MREVAPPDATVAVISKGDGDLLQLDGRRARGTSRRALMGNTPATHPADSDACIAELERIRAIGAEYS